MRKKRGRGGKEDGEGTEGGRKDEKGGKRGCKE